MCLVQISNNETILCLKQQKQKPSFLILLKTCQNQFTQKFGGDDNVMTVENDNGSETKPRQCNRVFSDNKYTPRNANA